MAHSMQSIGFPKRDALFDQIVLALDRMPDELREVFVLNHYLGKTPEQIASMIGSDAGELDTMLTSANRVFFRSLRAGSGK